MRWSGIVFAGLGIAAISGLASLKPVPIKPYVLPSGYEILTEKSPIGSEIFEYFNGAGIFPSYRGTLLRHSHAPTKPFYHESQTVLTFRSTTGYLVEWPTSVVYRSGLYLVKN